MAPFEKTEPETDGDDMEKKLRGRAAQTAETKKRILRTAQKLFEKHGLDNVTMRDISEYSGISIGSIYHHFRDKDEIVMNPIAHLDDIYSEIYREMSEDPAWSGVSATAKLSEFFVCVQLACIDAGQDPLRVYYLNALKYPDKPGERTGRSRSLYHIHIELIRACRAEGSITTDLSDDQIFELLIVTSRGLFVEWLLRQESFDMRETTTRAVGVLLRGLRD